MPTSVNVSYTTRVVDIVLRAQGFAGVIQQLFAAAVDISGCHESTAADSVQQGI